ncbi:inner-membrane translocator [Streptomyces sp. NPDC050617]|uniref:inner-membrane translocator n=1 Tax=Streptomyces sp. NPDC050617 TaxID=3154628 RepID=UPI003438F968
MPERADKQSSGVERALTAGCLLFLVLVAVVAAGLLVFLVAAARRLGRDTGGGKTATTGEPALDWGPVLGSGSLALAAGVTAVLLLRGGRRIGYVLLTLCVLLTVRTLGSLS